MVIRVTDIRFCVQLGLYHEIQNAMCEGSRLPINPRDSIADASLLARELNGAFTTKRILIVHEQNPNLEGDRKTSFDNCNGNRFHAATDGNILTVEVRKGGVVKHTFRSDRGFKIFCR